MATATPQSNPSPGRREILIVSHCTLFYWWPVWAVGFLMALISSPWVTGEHVVLVASGGETYTSAAGTITYDKTIDAKTKAKVTVNIEKQDVLVAPSPKTEKSPPIQMIHGTSVHISTSKNIGVFFVVVLLVVIFITNVPLRGLWSVIVIIFFVAMLIILGLLGILDTIVDLFVFLDIRITTGGYVVISSVLLALWLVIFFLFDQQIYMIFTPGQLRVKLEIGDAETAYDTTGMTIQKQRSDLFRHWILGIGSGDLIVKTAGAQGHQFDMANVLFLGRKVREIEDMLRSRQVVSGRE